MKKLKGIKDVHTEHCCIIHGCKYGKDDECTVMLRISPQSYPCESCNNDGIESIEQLNKVLKGEIKCCKHCGHIL